LALVMIVFELSGTGRKTDKLEEALQKLGNPCHILSNTRVVQTDLKPDQIFVSLKREFFQPQDRFIVAPLSQFWQAHNCNTFGKCYEDDESTKLQVPLGYSPLKLKI
jgi:hypothetical protein